MRHDIRVATAAVAVLLHASTGVAHEAPKPAPRERLLEHFTARAPGVFCAPERGIIGCLKLDAQQCEQRSAAAARECAAEFIAVMPPAIATLEEYTTWGERLGQCVGIKMLRGDNFAAVDVCIAQVHERQAAISKYIEPIRSRIRTRIQRPPAIPPEAEVIYEVTLTPAGDIVTLSSVFSTGHVAYENAVAKAIHAAAPFRVPTDLQLFREMRVLRLVFRAGPLPAPPAPFLPAEPQASVPEPAFTYPLRASVPRRKFVGTKPPAPFEAYVNESLRRILAVVNSNLPALREPGLRAHLIITLAVRADGTLESVDVNRRSGNPLVDDAIVGLVRLAAPFEPFTEAMRHETDVLHITRSFEVLGPAP